jgi:PST family polysaccharide transporter
MFAWFGVAGLFQIFLGTTNWLLMSQGRGHEYMRVMLFTSIVALLSFLAGRYWGARGIATAYVLGQGLVCLPWQLWVVGRTSHVRHRELFERLAPHLAALTIVIALVMFSRWQFGSPGWLLLSANVIAAYSAYAIVLFINARLCEKLRQI